MSKRNLIIIVAVVLVVAGGAYLLLRQRSASSANAADLQTAEIQRGTLTASVSGAGTIAALQTATLAWTRDGVVGKVNVSVGDAVNPGEVLMELEPGSLDPAVLQAQADLLAAQQELDTLLAGSTEQQLAQARLNVVQAQEAVTTAERALNNVKNPVGQALLDSVTSAQVAFDTAKANTELERVGADASAVQTAENSMNLAYSQLQRAQVEYDDCIKISCAERPQRERALTNAQNAYQTASNQFGEAKLKYDTQVNNLDLSVTTAQQNLDRAKANLAAAQAGPDPAKVALYQAQLDVANGNLKQAQDDLSSLQAAPDQQAVLAAQAKVAAAQAIVDSARLTAPIGGTVMAVYSRPGDLIGSNENAVVIADLSSLELNVDVFEVDINRIAIGQEVDLTVDAVPGQTFTGKVSAVLGLGASQQGVVTYPVTVVIPDPDPALKPGMTAAASIVTDRHENVLLVPNRAIQVRGGQRTVTVLFEGELIPVSVTLGLSNETHSEIVDGQVREDDTVVLNATTTATGNNQGAGGFFFGGGGGRP